MSTTPTNRLTRRHLLGLAAGGIAAATAGCSTQQPGTPGPSGSVAPAGQSAAPVGPVTLDVALWGDVKRADLYQKALDLFTKANANVTTKLQYADLAPYLERLATASAAKSLPDVLFMRDTHVGRYGKAKALLDLRPFIDNKTIDVSKIGQAAVADGTVQGGVYALPTHYVGQAIIYDEDKVKAAGIDMSKVTTWTALAAVAKTLTKGTTQYGMGDPTLGTTHRHLEAWIRQHGEEMFTPDGDVGFKAATVEEWFAFWDGLRKAGTIPPAAVQVESETGGNTNNLVVTGKGAIVAASTNHLTAFQALTKAKLGMSSVPANPGGSNDWWFFPPILISAAPNSKSPETAAKLISFLINDVEAGKVTKLNQGAPSSSAVRDAIAGDLDAPAKMFIEQISREQQQPRRPFPVRPEGAEAVNTAITFYGQEIAYGKATVKDATARLMAEAKQKLGK